MNIKYLKIAREEFHSAIKYYESQQVNLGRKFEVDIKESISRLKKFPKAYIIVSKDVRRCLLHKFNYSILYAIKHDHILIIAIAHQHRKPNYWIDRT
jgi:plasmid stabilization system protein ParE